MYGWTGIQGGEACMDRQVYRVGVYGWTGIQGGEVCTDRQVYRVGGMCMDIFSYIRAFQNP